ncbi:hypothetical protein Tco_1304799 [Tanacetum coccineum]
MGTTREIIDEGTEGPINLGPERPRVYSELSQEEKDRYNADIRATNIILQGLPKDTYSLINHYTDAKDIWDNVKMLLEGSELTKEDRESQLNMRQMPTVTILMLERLTQQTVDPLALMSNVSLHLLSVYNRQWVGPHSEKLHSTQASTELRNTLDKMLLMQAQENGVTLDDEQFIADDCDAYDSDVDDAPTAQTLFMANLSSADPVYDEAGPSYDSDVLSEVQAHDHYQDAVCDHHHEDTRVATTMYDPNHVVDSMLIIRSDSNMILMINNDLHDSYELVELYGERRARFELTEREQKIDEQLRIVICDRNIKEENLKKELHSIKLQLASTIQLNQVFYDEVNKVAIGYKNPLCLHRARQVQPALYSGHVIVTPNHATPRTYRDVRRPLELSEIS